MNNRNAWRLSIGIGLLAVFGGIPFYRMLAFVAGIHGWWYVARGLTLSLIWSTAITVGLILTVSEAINAMKGRK